MADPCSRCRGCGKIADSDSGEPWTDWEDLPPGSDLAVRAGIVKPMPCPECGGSGKATAAPTADGSPNAPEPAPRPGAAEPTWELVVRDMRERDAAGAAKYGVRHQHDNGRNHLVDAYQELLDGAVYLRAEIERRRVPTEWRIEAIQRKEAALWDAREAWLAENPGSVFPLGGSLLLRVFAAIELLHAEVNCPSETSAPPAPAPAMHLPAQMEELRAKLLETRANAGAPGDDIDAAWVHEQIDALLRLVPVQHDDQVGGVPVERAR